MVENLLPNSGLYHFAILLPTRQDLGISLRRLIDTGISYYTIIIPDHDALTETVHRLTDAGIAVREQEDAWFVQDPTGIEFKLMLSRI